MSISLAMSSALSGLKTTQEAMDVLANNIANVNTDGYARRHIEQSTVVGGGVKLDDIVRKIDKRLQGAIRSQSAEQAYAKTVKQYYDTIQVKFGNPNQANSLASQVNGFFTSLQNLSVNPDSSAARLDTITQARNLTSQISTFARDLHTLRFNAEQDIDAAVTKVNNLLGSIYQLNGKINDAKRQAIGTRSLDLLEQRDLKITELSQYINIQVFELGNDEISINTSDGISLLDHNQYKFKYTARNSVNDFINEATIGKMEVVAIDSSGTEIGVPQELVSSGSLTTVTKKMTSGSLKGLMDLRDTEIPRILNQLDEMVDTFKNAFNAIHNDGGGYPADNKLVGTRQVTATTMYDFTGKVQIGLVDSKGSPVTSPYFTADPTYEEEGVRPLTLDLSTLNSGSGAGSPTVKDIIDEINYFYGPPQARGSVGNLADIRLAMVDDAITTGGTFQFDFEMLNSSATDATVTITSIAVTDNMSVSQAPITPAVPHTAFTIAAGEHKRTGSAATVKFTESGGADVPYTVEVEFKVNDGTLDKTGKLRFVLGNGPLGVSKLRNDRVAASAVVSGDATVTPAPSNARLATAKLVDADGNDITNTTDGSLGFLQIETQTSTHGIVLNEMDSKETGLTSNTADPGTLRGFSHFFELNDFFVRNDTVSGSALNFSVRSDILDNPNLMALGSLVQSPQPSDPDKALYTYEMGKGANDVIKRLSDLKDSLLTFDAAGSFSTTTTTILDYSADIISFSANKASTATANFKQEDLFLKDFSERFKAGSGVNLDEELANTVVLQNTYAAAARAISVTGEMLELLLNAAAGR